MTSHAPEINHHRGGSGEPLVLIHGVGHHWQGWLPALPLIETHFDTYACDSPGFGASPPLAPGIPATIPNYATAFEAWFAAQGLDRPHVAGNSMGGAVAIELARRGAARSATAFSPAGFWTPRERAYCQRSLGAVAAIPRPARPAVRAALRTAPGRRAFLAQLIKRPADLPGELAVGDVDALWAAPSMAAALAGFTEYTCAPLPPEVTTPVRVVWGDADRLLLARTQPARARKVLPRAEHELIDAGHLPASDAPRAVADAIVSTARAAAPDPHAG
ncbi:MAG: alpha/beta hydrolase [Solirubrobacteraceae bacterium]|nr:alpha/beta hydrolase [Solirubrobacteraceae bacterium]